MHGPAVFISGPLTTGIEPAGHNVRVAGGVYNELIQRGFAPLCPHLGYFAQEELGCQFTHSEWLNICLVWLRRSDAVYQITGESLGTKVETDAAVGWDIPVFKDFPTLERWRHDEWRNGDWKIRSEPQRVLSKHDCRFVTQSDDVLETLAKKGHDYARKDDNLSNIRLVANRWRDPEWKYPLQKVDEKLNRLSNAAAGVTMSCESEDDTFRDIIGHTHIAWALWNEKQHRDTAT